MANATWYSWPTNFSNGSSITGIGSYFAYANEVTGGFLGAAILIIIFMMVLFAGMLMGVKRALASSCFITFIFSVYFWRLNMIHPAVPITLVVFTILFALGAKAEGSQY